MPYFVPNRHPGRLIVAEGIAGCGRSTQMDLLAGWLRSRGYAVITTAGSGSPFIADTLRTATQQRRLTPATFSLWHATALADSMESVIVPAIRAGAMVCADGYAYTAFARDVVRGIGRKWVHNLYRFALLPSLRFYFRVTLDVALERLRSHQEDLQYYDAGMDLGLSPSTEESFRLFQGRIIEEYEAMTREADFHIIDAAQPIEIQQRKLRAAVTRELKLSRGRGLLRTAQESAHARPAAARIL